MGMIPDDQYKSLLERSSIGSRGSFGIKIHVACRPFVDFKTDDMDIWRVVDEAADKIEDIIRTKALAYDPAIQAEAAKEKADLLALFPSAIFVQPIPNGYCPKYCCKHLPWFNVVTEVGVIQLGWRKRVINIDWTGVPRSLKSEELFPAEEVTKGDKYIHAWGYEKAKEYILTIINHAKVPLLQHNETKALM